MAAKPFRTRIERIIESIHEAGLRAPPTIVFGKGKLDELGELAVPFARGQKALVVLGGRSAVQSGLADRIQTILSRCTIGFTAYPGIHREPTVALVDEAAAFARREAPKLVVSVGGGSVIDCGKAVAALAVNEGSVEDYLEGVGRDLPLAHAPLPHIAVPTVAGTGSEMTKNAVIGNLEKGYKKSMRFDAMIPQAAVVDPLLTLGVPLHVVAAGGMDTITQLLEPCITIKRRPETTALALEGLRGVRQALSIAYEDPDHVAAREELSLASMLSGVCLANSGLAMAHGIAAALGALFDVPHGLACGILLPHTLRYNRPACPRELAQALAAFLGQPKPVPQTIEEGLEAIESLKRWLQVPPDLKYLGLKEPDLVRLAEASAGSSMSGNPIPMTPEKTLEFLSTIA